MAEKDLVYLSKWGDDKQNINTAIIVIQSIVLFLGAQQILKRNWLASRSVHFQARIRIRKLYEKLDSFFSLLCLQHCNTNFPFKLDTLTFLFNDPSPLFLFAFFSQRECTVNVPSLQQTIFLNFPSSPWGTVRALLSVSNKKPKPGTWSCLTYNGK